MSPAADRIVYAIVLKPGSGTSSGLGEKCTGCALALVLLRGLKSRGVTLAIRKLSKELLAAGTRSEASILTDRPARSCTDCDVLPTSRSLAFGLRSAER